ncbi:MAG TPA: single-stranded-DNA-specific exonuclease RecJ, partial [Burkholderiales bacterium]|nr:single-stranded-DNA-specific exonuclease RecJ [Burkholderiales bacterium]
ERFLTKFEAAARSVLTPADLERQIQTDGPLDAADITLDGALLMRSQVWGAGFPEPRFYDTFAVMDQRSVGERHLKLRLSRQQRIFDAMLFGAATPLPSCVAAVYRVDVNEYDGTRGVQLCIEQWHETGS